MKPKSLIWIGLLLAILSSISAFEVKVNSPFPGQMLSGIYEINITCDSDFDNISIYLDDSLQDSFVPPGCNYNHNFLTYSFDTNLVGNGAYTLRVIASKNDVVVSDSVEQVTVKNTFITRALDKTAEFLGNQILSKNYFFIGVLLVTLLFVIMLFSVRIMAAPHHAYPGDHDAQAEEFKQANKQQNRPFEIIPLEEMPRHKTADAESEIETKVEETDTRVEEAIESIKEEQKQEYISFKKQKELEFFVKHCRRQGYSSEAIRKMLVKQGWDEAFINEFLKNF